MRISTSLLPKPRKIAKRGLYEVMWGQRTTFPHLPFPYLLHVLIQGLIKEGVSKVLYNDLNATCAFLRFPKFPIPLLIP